MPAPTISHMLRDATGFHRGVRNAILCVQWTDWPAEFRVIAPGCKLDWGPNGSANLAWKAIGSPMGGLPPSYWTGLEYNNGWGANDDYSEARLRAVVKDGHLQWELHIWSQNDGDYGEWLGYYDPAAVGTIFTPVHVFTGGVVAGSSMHFADPISIANP